MTLAVNVSWTPEARLCFNEATFAVFFCFNWDSLRKAAAVPRLAGSLSQLNDFDGIVDWDLADEVVEVHQHNHTI